ncbi:hypothetical protein RIVM261_048400 [Rivularia sp. IAM M-261]|nr:hypothetical protein RIVM261_048400 [Rivularia sp. IAM M-261]
MNLIKQVYNAVSNWLNHNLMNPTHSIREIIPGWDDDYPDPIFTDEWQLTSEADLSSTIKNDNYDVEVETADNMDLNDFHKEKNQYQELTTSCNNCKYFHGQGYGDNDIAFICAVKPYGDTNCSDFELIDVDNLYSDLEPDDTFDLTEEDELRAAYGPYYEFVKDAEWKGDWLDNYLGKHDAEQQD